MVLRKFDRTIFVDGLGHVFDRGQFDDVNDELKEVAKKVEAKRMDITVSIFIISTHNLFSTFTNQLCKLQLYNGLEF